MEWKYVKKLSDKHLIQEFEELVNYKFPAGFIDCVLNCNGGRPSFSTFDTAVTKERSIKTLLSFNKEDKETVWKANEWYRKELSGKYAVFAADNFGNIICFDMKDDSIVFIDHENLKAEHIADSFDDFINGLYE